MTDLIAVAVLLAVLGAAAWYIYREKKSGAACIGCPYAKSCGGKQGSCSCHTDTKDKHSN